MRTQLKAFAAALVAVIMTVALGICASAAGSYTAVLDVRDNSISSSDVYDLGIVMQKTADKIHCNIAIVVTDDLEGESDKSYTNKYLDKNFGAHSDTLVLLLNNDKSNMSYKDYIVFNGRANTLFGEKRNAIFDDMYKKLGDNNYNYVAGIKAFCKSLEKHGSNNPFVRLKLSTILIVLGIALLIGFVAASIAAAPYAHKPPISAAHYINDSRTQYSRTEDIFITETTTHHHVQSSSHGGHGGGHGGGGRSGGAGRRR